MLNHFLKKPSVLGNTIAAIAIGLATTHKITIAWRTSKITTKLKIPNTATAKAAKIPPAPATTVASPAPAAKNVATSLTSLSKPVFPPICSAVTEISKNNLKIFLPNILEISTPITATYQDRFMRIAITKILGSIFLMP